MKKWKVAVAFVLLSAFLVSAIPANAAEWIIQKIEAKYHDIKIIIDGEEIVPKDVDGTIVEPFVIDGTTYVPLRAIGEAFGKEVKWDSDTATVYIDTPDEPVYRPDPPPTPGNNIEVATVEELFDAIAPDTCIILKAGQYDISSVVDSESDYAYWRDDELEMDEKTLVISGVEGLMLQAAPGADVEIVTPWRYAEVLAFSQCNGVSLIGIKAGHSVTGEYECDAGVVAFEDSYHIYIDDCLFYGCGAIGITLTDCVVAQISDTTVTDCSLRAIDIFESYDATFSNCKFNDNRAYGCVINGSTSSVEFTDCEIKGNKNLLWSVVEFFGESYVLFENCVFQDNALTDASEEEELVFNGQWFHLRDCEIELSNFSGYWDGGVVDHGGNVLK